MTRSFSPRTQSVLVALGLFLLALLVRLPYLGTFMTIDEVKWVEGAGQFLTGLAEGDLFTTYWHFFPGVTTTWGEALILWVQYLAGDAVTIDTFVQTQLANLPGIIGAMRLSPVVITALGVAGVYWLARPLLGTSAALLGAALLAVDPFFVAHSRIVNGDAVAAVLMLLALLAFAQLWLEPRWRKAALAGLFAGLAILTKLPAPIILPLLTIPAGLGYLKNRSLRFWLLALFTAGAGATITFVLLFPAMWVEPLETLRLIYVEAFDVGEAGEGHDTFFLGQISNDPGWLFYPYAIAFRLTPIAVAGLLALPFQAWSRRRAPLTSRAMLVITLLIYVVLVYLFANISPKKLDRYVMAVIPALLLLAGIGLDGLLTTLVRRGLRASLSPLLAGGLVAVQAIFTVVNYPYVLTYYNPLLGGFARAAGQVPVGWGEGMEQAAAWLNAQPNAGNLRVSSWYRDMAEPYLDTQTVSFSSSGKDQLAADYVIFYLNQTQRQKPNAPLVNYFTGIEPVFQVTHGGTPYVWVYPAPAMQPVSGSPTIEGRGQLLGYKWQPEAVWRAGNSVDLTLFMSTLGDLAQNETFAAALVAPDGSLHGEWGSARPATWLPDAIVAWSGVLTLPPDLPSGEYRLVVRLMDTNLNSEVTRFAPDNPTIITLE